MAYDKVVDSSVLDAGLKQIADAIREKGGTSDNLAFPTAMAEAIAAIQASGGAKVELSELTPAADVLSSAPLTVNHTLGVVPDFVCVFAKETPVSGSYGIVCGITLLKPRFVLGGKNTLHYAYSYRASSYNAKSGSSTTTSNNLNDFLSIKSSLVSDMTETTLTLAGICNNNVIKLVAGSSYFLIVGAIVDE